METMRALKHKKMISLLVALIALLAIVAAGAGIIDVSGSGSYLYSTIRGQEILIYGQGLYRHMSAEVAVQGIAQDYVTLLLAIPILLIALVRARRGSLRGRLVLAGTLLYFLLTYLFYLTMGMYNYLFLVYVALLGLAFYALILSLGELIPWTPAEMPIQPWQRKLAGGYLILNGLMVGALWLGVIVPPLLDGTIYPAGLDHYTTMIVQGFDLALFLPASILCGWLLWRDSSWGRILAPVYLVFLSLLMTALVAKIIFMAMTGANVFPVAIIMPINCVFAWGMNVLLLHSFSGAGHQDRPHDPPG